MDSPDRHRKKYAEGFETGGWPIPRGWRSPARRSCRIPPVSQPDGVLRQIGIRFAGRLQRRQRVLKFLPNPVVRDLFNRFPIGNDKIMGRQQMKNTVVKTFSVRGKIDTVIQES